MFIRQHPYCEMESVCVERTGHAAPSTDVHHIKGVVEHPELAFEYTNLQAACHECHSQHTARTEGFAQRKKEERAVTTQATVT
jgi:5-methylcytosine-specific restriction endonuclease McrA